MVGGLARHQRPGIEPHSPAALRAFADAGYCPEENPIGATEHLVSGRGRCPKPCSSVFALTRADSHDGADCHAGRMHQCCFCSQSLPPDSSDAFALVVVAASRAQESTAPTQTMWAHPACLAERLAAGVPFDGEAFFD
jgi:hypothetical protein